MARTPEALAVVNEERAWTYAELHRQVVRLAWRLRAAGVGPDQPVVLCAERGVGLVSGLLGILEAGGAYLAVEPDLPRTRLELLARDARVAVAVTERGLTSRLPSGLQQVFLDLAGAEDGELDLGAMPPAAVGPGHLAYVLYTSGSTGTPKGVMVEHRQLTAYVRGVVERLAPAPGASFATVSSLAADLGNTSIFAALLSGGCLHVVARERLTDADAFAELMQRQPVDVLKIVPSHLAALLATERPGRCLPRQLLVLGGEALPWSLVDRVRALAQCRVVNHYGPTETTVGVLAGAVDETAGARGSAVAPLGRPLGHTRVWVVDHHRQLVPAGIPGELCVGGPQVTRGYLGRPDLTAERFLPDPFGIEPGGRLYRTGDRVRWTAAGELEFLGRLDRQVKVRGFRIEQGEIEAALAALAGVREAAVVVREDSPDGGPGGRRLVAYVAGDASAAADDTLRRSLRERLPDYMVPAVFVRLAALPLTPNGKVDRNALPAPERPDDEGGFLAPRTPVEELLAGIFAEILGLRRLGASDHFFDLGGHSLLATRLRSRVREAFGVELPLRTLFERPRLADLAAEIEALRSAGAAPRRVSIVHGQRNGPLPLSVNQQRFWFLQQLNPASPAFNLSAAVRLSGPLDGAALEASFGEIVRRHSTVRTRVVMVAGVPHQIVDPPGALTLARVDLSGLGAVVREGELRHIVQSAAHRPFDLAGEPPLQVLLLRLADDDYAVLFSLHHIAGDGWSLDILTRELGVLYAACTEGRPSPLPELPIQYADWVAAQQEWLRGPAGAAQLAYWRRKLGGDLPVLTLPMQRQRPSTGVSAAPGSR